MRHQLVDGFRWRVAATVLILTTGSGYSQQAGPGQISDPAAPSTKEMAQALELIAQRANDTGANPFAPGARARYMRSLTPPSDLRELLLFKVQLATYLLNEGLTREAVTHFEDILRLVVDNQSVLERKTIANVRGLLGIAFLRLGEQENCILNHNVESCLLPIRGEGVHKLQEGSRRAIRELTALLEQEPEEWSAIWLLNLAYMTVGEYPDGVPVRWRIRPEKFVSEYDIGRFPDRAPALGLDTVGLSGGAIMEDFDNDGFLDLVCSSWGLRDQLHYFRNNGDGTFTDRTREAGLLGVLGGLNMVHADYDNDGDNDFYIMRGAWLGKIGKHPNSLLRNNGDGTFTDATRQTGLFSLHPSHTAAWGDFDNDGHLDLFVGYDSTKSDPNPSELFRNNGDGTFTEISRQVGVNVDAFVKGAVWGDYDNDGKLDLYVSALLEPNLLFHNLGPDSSGVWRFEEVAAKAGVQEPLHSFPTWWFDYNNDGWLDLFASGFEIDYISITVDDIAREYLDLPTRAEKPRLYRNNGNGTFTDVTREAGVYRILYTMGCNIGDLDNDGWLDFYAATGAPDYRVLVPNLMFRNDHGRRFQDVTSSGGFGHLQKGHGVAFGDLDNDGDQDIYTVMGGAYTGDVYQNVLFENPGHGNRWLTLKLEGTRSNRSAIGTRIRVRVEEDNRQRDIYLTVGTGGSFGSSSLQQEIGLGRAERIVETEIRWASGGVQTVSALEVDRAYRIKEGEAEPVPLTLRRISLSGSHSAGAHLH